MKRGARRLISAGILKIKFHLFKGINIYSRITAENTSDDHLGGKTLYETVGSDYEREILKLLEQHMKGDTQ